MNHLRSIDEVAETLQNAKSRGKGCTLLIGAGCSVKAGIPHAAGLIQVIKERDPRAYQRAVTKTYAGCMSELLLSDRNRFDLNFSGGDFDPRYRNRVRLDRNVDFGKWALNPYAYGEFVYDFDQGQWIRTRVTGGLELHVWERVVPEVYFQRDFNSGSTGDVNGFGLVLSIYLR